MTVGKSHVLRYHHDGPVTLDGIELPAISMKVEPMPSTLSGPRVLVHLVLEFFGPAGIVDVTLLPKKPVSD